MENIDINSLKANPKNPRRISEHDFKSLVEGIKKFGPLDGIVFNETTGQLAGGHQRIQAFKQLGGQPVITERYEEPTVTGTVAVGYVLLNNEKYGYRVVRWSKEWEQSASILANRAQGEWDLDLLAEINYELSQLENGADLLALTGQTEDEVNRLLDAVGANGERDPAEDEAPEVDNANPPVSKLGEIYQLGRHRLMCGDSTDFGAVSDLMDGKLADMVFTDPPYGIKRDKGFEGFEGFGGFGAPIKRRRYEDGDWDNDIPPKECFDLMLTLAPKVIIFGGNFFAHFLPQGKHWIVWDKKNTMPTFGDAELAWTNIDRDSVKIKEFQYNGLIGKEKERFHPTQKPIGLMANIIEDYTNSNQSVLDLFLGSGSTLIACEQTDRICYGMELDPKYVDVIRKRYHKHTTGSEEGWQEATPVINSSEVKEPQPQPDPNPQVAQSPDPGIERTEPPQPAEIMPEQQNEPSTI